MTITPRGSSFTINGMQAKGVFSAPTTGLSLITTVPVSRHCSTQPDRANRRLRVLHTLWLVGEKNDPLPPRMPRSRCGHWLLSAPTFSWWTWTLDLTCSQWAHSAAGIEGISHGGKLVKMRGS